MARELDGFARMQQENQSFGSYSREIVQLANELRCYLSDEGRDFDEPGWTDVDINALTEWQELEYDLANLPVMIDDTAAESDKANTQLDEFFDLRHIFHTAMPFDEAERAWFLKIYASNRESLCSPKDLLQAMGYYEERIVSAGLRQVVSGRELSNRWLAWRRETDEYADQGTLDVATAALGQLATLFAVPEPWANAPTA